MQKRPRGTGISRTYGLVLVGACPHGIFLGKISTPEIIPQLSSSLAIEFVLSEQRSTDISDFVRLIATKHSTHQ